MNNRFLETITNHILEKKKKKKWRMAVTGLAGCVVFCTVYALILPAITMEGQTYCGNEEHEHTDQCYSDPQADVEDAGTWEATIPIPLSGEWRADAAAIAVSQQGYRESEANYLVDENGNHDGYTRYGAYMGDPYGDWSTSFVEFCTQYAGITDQEILYHMNCQQWLSNLQQSQKLLPADQVSKEGTLIFLDLDYDGAADHVGIVTEIVKAGDVVASWRVLVGDVDKTIQKLELNGSESYITGCFELPTNVEEVVETVPAEPVAEEAVPAEPEAQESQAEEETQAEAAPEESEEGVPEELETEGNPEADVAETEDEAPEVVLDEEDNISETEEEMLMDAPMLMAFDMPQVLADTRAMNGATVSVTKEWNESSHPSRVTVWLYDSNGNKVTAAGSKTLSASNGWSATWTGLDYGQYSVKEDPIDGWSTSVRKETEEQPLWVKTKTLSNEQNVAIVYQYNGQYYIAASSSSSGLSGTRITAPKTETINGTSEKILSSSPSAYQQWTTKYGTATSTYTYSGFLFINAGNGKYLSISPRVETTAGASASQLFNYRSVTETGGLLQEAYTSKYMMSTDSTLQATSYYSSAGKYELYQVKNLPTLQNFELKGYKTEVIDTNQSLRVSKVWGDGKDSHNSDSVVVNLRKDGKKTGDTITLNAANNWEGIFSNLSGTGYDIEENAVDGYSARYTTEYNGREVWIPAYSIIPGETYAVFQNDRVVQIDSTRSDLELFALTGKENLVFNDQSFDSYLENVPESAMWRAQEGTAGYYFYNEASNRYINYVSNQTPPEFAVSSYYREELNYSGEDGKVYTVLENPTVYISSETNATTDETADGTTWQLYRRVSLNEIGMEVINNRKMSKNETSTTVTVKKEWADGAAYHRGETVTVYLYDEQGQLVPGLPALELNAANNWKGSWEDLPEQNYTVREDLIEGYQASVEASATSEVIWVPATTLENQEIYTIVNKASIPTSMFTTATATAVGLEKNATSSGQDLAYSGSNITIRRRVDPTGGYSFYLNDDVPIEAQWVARKGTYGFQMCSSRINNAAYGALMGVDSTTYGSVKTFFGKDLESNPSYYYTYLNYNNSTGRITFTNFNGSTGYYLRNYNAKTTTSTSAGQYTLFKRITKSTRNYVITNTPVTTGGSNSDIKLDHNKSIDALRDLDNNPDTTLDDEAVRNSDKDSMSDLYRLYLDAGLGTQKSEPVDLILVVDASGSMDEKTEYYTNNRGATSQVPRDTIVNNVLSTDYNLAQKFLQMNTKNKLSVIKFGGYPGANSEYIYSSVHYTYDVENATTTGKKWYSPSDSLSINVDAPSSAGTNYCAGFKLAYEYLNEVKNDGNKKIMIFISDGVPTYYLPMTNGELADNQRKGNGSSEQGNATSCLEPSKQGFDWFNQKCQAMGIDLTTYTVGFSSDLGGSSNDVSTNPTVLRYMALQGGGTFYYAPDGNTLKSALESMMLEGGLATNFSISDELSDYVNLYEKQIDYKVTMTKPVNGRNVTTVLWENGAATAAGTDIIQSVGADGKTVKAVFVPTYALEKDAKYTLSFNVETTQQAYDEYAEQRIAGKDGYSNTVGEMNTDYGTNQTSSKKPGFFSNNKAFANVTVGSNSYAFTYQKPVVQVADGSLVLKKVSDEGDWKTLAGAKFALYRKAVETDAARELVAVDGIDEKVVKVKDNLETGDQGTVSVTNLTPGIYYLVETEAPEGFLKMQDPAAFTLVRKVVKMESDNMLIVATDGNKNNSPMITVTNTESFVLPETGGGGARTITWLGVIMVIFAISSLQIMTRMRKKE